MILHTLFMQIVFGYICMLFLLPLFCQKEIRVLEVSHFFELLSSSGAGTGCAGVPRILPAYLHLIIALTWAHFQSLDRSVLVRLASTGLVCLDRHALSAVCSWSLLLT